MYLFTLIRQQFSSMNHFLRTGVFRATCVMFAVYMAVTNAKAFDFGAIADGALKAISSTSADNQASVVAGESGKIEVGFSPNGGALPLILKVINSSSKTLDVMAYSFTSADITRALISAQKRGVKVRLLADYKHNMTNSSAKYSQSAMSALVNAGADVRLVDGFAIFHDKIVIADSTTVQTGSFNYSKAAANANSENVVVMWGAPAVAAQYNAHFRSRWNNSKRYSGRP